MKKSSDSPHHNSAGNLIWIARQLLLVAMCFVAIACSLTDPDNAILPGETRTVRFEPWEQKAPLYRLQSGDRIDVIHPYSAHLNQQVEILPDGRIYLPIIGGIEAADLSPDQLSAQLVSAYSEQLNSPFVTVVPQKINNQEVYVGGEVDEPGVYEFHGTIGVIEALFMAGGSLVTANREDVVVLRRTENNAAMMRTINVASILEGRPGALDIPLHQFDIVFVPKSSAAEIGDWVTLNINRILPFSRSFSYSLGDEQN